MNELFKALSTFVARDIIYMIGGSTILFTLAYLTYVYSPDTVQQLQQVAETNGVKNLSTTAQLFLMPFGLGVAWVFGYVTQDGLSFTRIVTTAPLPNPHYIVQWLYHRFTGSPWENIDRREYSNATIIVDELASSRTVAKLERIITLKHVGSTMGSCWFISSILVLVGSWKPEWQITSLRLGIALLVISVVLLALSQVKNLQQQRHTILLGQWLQQNRTCPTKE